MKRIIYYGLLLLGCCPLVSWTTSQRCSWSMQSNGHSLVKAVNQIFYDIYNLNYITSGNKKDSENRWKYEILINSGYLDSIKFRVNDTLFLHFDGGFVYALWNNSIKKNPHTYKIYRAHRKNRQESGIASGINPDYISLFNNWDSISIRKIHDLQLKKNPQERPDSPCEIIRMIVTTEGIKIDGFEY